MSLFWCYLHYESNAWLLLEVKYKDISKFSLWSNMGSTVLNVPWTYGEKSVSFLFKGWKVFFLYLWVHVHMWVLAYTCKKFTYSTVQVLHVLIFLPPGDVQFWYAHTKISYDNYFISPVNENGDWRIIQQWIEMQELK